MGGGGLSIGGDHGKSRRPGHESGGGEGGGRAGKEGESGKVLHGGSVGINGFGSSGKPQHASTCVLHVLFPPGYASKFSVWPSSVTIVADRLFLRKLH